MRIARIQFALTGVNAHINHDLPEAIVATARALNLIPTDGSPEHQDFIAVDAVRDLSEAGSAALNRRCVDDPRVRYLEIAGVGRDGLFHTSAFFAPTFLFVHAVARPPNSAPTFDYLRAYEHIIRDGVLS